MSEVKEIIDIKLDGELFEDFRIKLDREINYVAMKLKDRDDLEDVEVTTKIKIKKVEMQLENGTYVDVPSISYDINSKMSVVNKESGGIYLSNKFELVEDKGQMKLKRIIEPQMRLNNCD